MAKSVITFLFDGGQVFQESWGLADGHKQLRPGPIRHETLPPELLEQVKAVYDVFGSYIGMTLEQFEVGFMRDMHPESEVALWCSITAAWLAYHEKYLNDETLPD